MRERQATRSEERLGLDIVLAVDPYEEQIAARAVFLDIGGERIPIASAEDVVVMKLLAGRPRDHGDVADVLAAMPEIDLDYIRDLVVLLARGLARDDLEPAFEDALRLAGRTGSRSDD